MFGIQNICLVVMGIQYNICIKIKGIQYNICIMLMGIHAVITFVLALRHKHRNVGTDKTLRSKSSRFWNTCIHVYWHVWMGLTTRLSVAVNYWRMDWFTSDMWINVSNNVTLFSWAYVSSLSEFQVRRDRFDWMKKDNTIYFTERSLWDPCELSHCQDTTIPPD